MSVPPPVGKHRQPNAPPGWAGPPTADREMNAARGSRVHKKLAIWVAAIVVGVIVGAVTPGLAGHVIALVVWAVAAGACVRPARSVSASGAWRWARVGVVCFAAFAILAGTYAVKSVFFPNSSSGQNSSTPATSNFDACYLTLTGAEVAEYVSVDMAAGQTCSTFALAIQQEFAGATVTSDGSSKPWGAGWSAACMGSLTSANDPATVVAEGGDDTGDVCSTLGFDAIP
jgi:hypothetical protein